MRGKRLLLLNKHNMVKKFDGTQLENYTGCSDEINARTLHKQFVTFPPQFTFFVCANSTPVIIGADRAVENKQSIVLFQKRFIIM
jgi:phage/plasmid-associated DNA primase